MRHIPLSLVAAVTLSGCVSSPPIARPVPIPRFDALEFFSGRTLGIGYLKKIGSGSERTTVHGNGRIEGATLVLNQTVVEGGRPEKSRTWRIRQVTEGHYEGTLSDATGPIAGNVEGNRLHLAFTMQGGLPTEQWLTLSADGRSAHNIMKVRKFGVLVAVLDEDISKTD